MRLRVALDPENWETRDAGTAVTGTLAAREPAPGEIEAQLTRAMSQGVISDAYRRRRAYPTIDLANRDIRRGDLDAAIVEYQRYLETDPGHLVIRWRLVELLRERHRDAEVLPHADRILDALPGFGLAVVARAQALAALGRSDEAMDGFVRALRMGNIPPSARTQALGALVNTALSSGRLAEADSLLAAEPGGPAGSPAALALLAARATLAERAEHPAEAAALWAKIAASAPEPERRRAVLAEAQLLSEAGQQRQALTLLQNPNSIALFSPDAKALPATRLRYERLVSVLAEQLGETGLAAAASAAAAELEHDQPDAEGAAAGLEDRMRAARLQRRGDGGAQAALSFLLGPDRRPLPRPRGVSDAARADYLLLLADIAQRAGEAALATEALDAVPAASAEEWRTAAEAAGVSERLGQTERAAGLWAKVAAAAPDAGDRRLALLSQATLLDQAGHSGAALDVLETEAARTLFAQDAPAAERRRYQRTISVLAERTGRLDLARSAAEQAATEPAGAPAPGPAATLSADEMLDHIRAARLAARVGAPGAGLSHLLDHDGAPFRRPEAANDALWTDYTLLLGEAGLRAGKTSLVQEAVAATPASAAGDWRTAARLGELALAVKAAAPAQAALHAWDATALAAAGADRTESLTVLLLRADAARLAGDHAAEGMTAAEIEVINPRIATPQDRAQRLLAAGDAPGAIALLDAARPVLQASLATASTSDRPAAQHRLAQLQLALAQAEMRAGHAAQALAATEASLTIEDAWPVRFQLAEMLRKQGRRTEAAAAFHAAALNAPSRADAQLAWLTYGDLLYADHDYAHAYDTFQAAVSAGAGAPGRLRLAETADRLGRYADEAQTLEPLAGDRLNRARLCQVLLKAGDRPEASHCLDQLVAVAGNDPFVWRVAANIAGVLARNADRVRYLETAYRLAPQPDTGLEMGDSLMANHQPAEAAAAYAAVAAATGSPRALVGRGEALLAAHQPAAAADALREVVANPSLTPPLQARAYAALGYAQDADGDPQAAIASWRRARQLGASGDLALAEAEALLRTGHADKAQAVLAAAPPPPGPQGPGPALDSQRQALEVKLALARGDAAARDRAEALARAAPTADHLTLLAQARAAAGDKAGAVAASEQAAAAAPGDPQVQAQAGYTALAAGAPKEAAQRFEAAIADDPGRLGLHQDLPRAYVLAGEWPEARRAYAEAIKETAARVAASGDPRDQLALQELQGENAAATDEFAFELVDTLCAPSNAVGCGLALPVIERLGSAGIGAASVGWSPHLPGDPDPQRLTLYARLLWSNNPGSYEILSRTLQGGVGLRVQPINGIPVYLWAEHLFAIGSQAQDNWLLRVTAGWETGAGFRVAGTPDWSRDWRPYLFIYGDLGHFLIRQQDWLGTLEGRIGLSHQPFDNALFVPYVFLRGELDSATTGASSDVQIGVGASVRLRFLHDPLLGYRLQPELFIRLSHDLSRSGDRTGTRFLLGLIARF